MRASYRVIAISDDIGQYVRSAGKAPGYGHPAYTSVATGHGPCRHCLRTFRVGEEERILFTYDPFEGIEEVPLPGPIFIHAEACSRYPEDAGYPEDLRPHPAVLVAYSKGQRVMTQVIAGEGKQQSALEQLIDHPDVDYIMVRDREAGCYDFRIERLAADASDLTARLTMNHHIRNALDGVELAAHSPTRKQQLSTCMNRHRASSGLCGNCCRRVTGLRNNLRYTSMFSTISTR